MEGIYLRDIKYSGTILSETKYFELVKDQIRFYYNLRTDTPGFDFYVVEFVAVLCDNKNNSPDIFDNPDVEVECVYHGNVSFDGLRHLYMGHKETSNEGYLYYANQEYHILIFQKLDELISKYCSSP